MKQKYIENPCGTLATAFWKAEYFPVPEGIRVLLEKDTPQNAEIVGRYFRLIHYPQKKYDTALADGFTYRAAKLPEDFAVIAEIINRCYGYEYTADDISEWTKYPVFDSGLWVFVIDKKTGLPAALGTADFDKGICEGSLEWIQVLPEYQGKGLGTKIVNELLRRLSMKAKFVTVSGDIENPANPEKLYRKCGFSGNDVWLVIRN